MYRSTLAACVLVTATECPDPEPTPDAPPPPADAPIADPGDGGGTLDDGFDKRRPHATSTRTYTGSLVITSITSDEPIDVRGGGDGNTQGYDASILGSVEFEIRAERQGDGNGRAYHVNFVDGVGAEGRCTFYVPVEKGVPVVDDAAKVVTHP